MNDDKPSVKVKTLEVTCAGLGDHVRVWQTFLEIVNKLPGVTVLKTSKHVFAGGGMSGVAIIGESHAAIHTWPEQNFAWCELATCGDPAACDAFESLIRSRVENPDEVF